MYFFDLWYTTSTTRQSQQSAIQTRFSSGCAITPTPHAALKHFLFCFIPDELCLSMSRSAFACDI